MKRTHRKWLIALLIAAATLAAYWPVTDNAFVNYDDDLYIVNNPHVKRGLDAKSVSWAFSTFRGANWFPLTWLSWAVDFELYGNDPAGFHLTSLLLHTANSALLFLAFESLSGALWPSAFVGAVFALHPLHVESVAWAAARKDVLSGFFAMLVLLAYSRYVRAGRKHYPALFCCLALGLMAKPTLVTLPFVLLLLDEWPLGRLRRADRADAWDGAKLRRAVLEKLPLLLLAVAISGVAVASQSSWGTIQPLERLPLQVRIENALVAYGSYLVQAFWPTGLSVFYPHPGADLELWKVVVAALSLLGVSIGVVRVWRRHPQYAVGWFWYLGMLVPVIGLVQVGEAARADRYSYLSLIGVSIAVAWGGAALAARGRGTRRALAVLAVGAVTALGAGARAQTRLWKDSVTLFRHALEVTDDNHVAHINLGVALHGEGEYDRAAEHLEEALRLAPASATALGVMGDVRLAQDRAALALRYYRRALRREPDSLRWNEGIGNALLKLGRPEQAVESYHRALGIKANAARIHGHLGLALFELGRYDEAIAAYEEALRLNPELAEFEGNLGVALAEIGELDRAVTHFERALALRPDLDLFHAHLGNLLALRGDFDSAIEHLRVALRRDPANGQYHTAMALALDRAGRGSEALPHYREALAAGSRSAVNLVGLARLLIDAGEGEEAVALSLEAVEATQRNTPGILATLGAAYAAVGRYDDAIRATAEAAALAEARGKAELSARYRDQIAAYREAMRPAE